MAERGDSGQLTYIENIDLKYIRVSKSSGKANDQKGAEKMTTATSNAPVALLKTPKSVEKWLSAMFIVQNLTQYTCMFVSSLIFF